MYVIEKVFFYLERKHKYNMFTVGVRGGDSVQLDMKLITSSKEHIVNVGLCSLTHRRRLV